LPINIENLEPPSMPSAPRKAGSETRTKMNEHRIDISEMWVRTKARSHAGFIFLGGLGVLGGSVHGF
jgi:hypothetical protein